MNKTIFPCSELHFNKLYGTIYFSEKILQRRLLVVLCCNKWTHHNQADAPNHVCCHCICFMLLHFLLLHLQYFHLTCKEVIYSFSKNGNKYCSSPVQQNGQPVISVDIFLQVFDCLRFKITLFVENKNQANHQLFLHPQHVTDILSIWFVCHHHLRHLF